MSWDFPFWRKFRSMRGQVVPSTGKKVDDQVDAIIKNKQAEWKAKGWSQGLINAATNQMVDYAEGIAQYAGGGNPQTEEDIIRNLFVSGKAPAMADKFGTDFLAAMTTK